MQLVIASARCFFRVIFSLCYTFCMWYVKKALPTEQSQKLLGRDPQVVFGHASTLNQICLQLGHCFSRSSTLYLSSSAD